MRIRLLLTTLLLGLLGPEASLATAAELKLLLPLNRKPYQINETIDLSVVRSAASALPAGDLVLKLQSEDGSRLTFTFPVKKVEAEGGKAQAVEHLHVNGWLLRPGNYKVEVACDGGTATTTIEVYSHVRRSSFRLINWGRAKGKAQLPQGEDNLGYNLFYAHYAQDDEGNFIRAGIDYMANCVMSGAHQMDLRAECDWSDPYVIRGGTRRVARRAFIDRTWPNAVGVHFYDEPGLTWLKDPVTGESSPQGIPAQLRSYEAAFGKPLIDHHKVDPKNPQHVALWSHWARWKLGFMDAAWKDAQFGVSHVKPDLLSVTQSQYGFSAFTDGYYFNVVRSLPVISGHGGYHDFGPGYFNPSLFLEFARARDLSRPNWYLPTWYGNTTSDQFRLEQYLSFQMNIQGMMSPPDLEPGDPAKCKAVDGIVESNHLMGRLGTVFTTMRPTRPPVTVLFSLSQMIDKQTKNMKVSYAHETEHGRNVQFAYLAGKLLQHQFLVVLDEDVLDGTLAADHKAVILTSLDYLDPKVIAALEDFVKQGGLVLATSDCKVKVKGAVDVGVTPAFPDAARIAELLKAKKNQEAWALTKLRYALQGAEKLAGALRPHLEKAGIKPVFTSDVSGISATRQRSGDIEYLFAINATHDEKGDPMLGMKAVSVKLGVEADGRPIYDAVHGGSATAFISKGKQLQGQFRFGPGQMRVFARTARPIGGVRVGTPIVRRDYTQRQAPLRIDLAATLLDEKGDILSGSAPLRIRVIDPLGTVRYDLYRATKEGVLSLSLPLALNDPAGVWKVSVSELLDNTQALATFKLTAAPTCSAAMGATRRAVHVAADRGNIFRFFRTQHKVTIVKGSSAYNNAAAGRLQKVLKPWNVECSIITAAEANKARSLTPEEAATWVGLYHAGTGQIKPGDKNDPVQVGYAVQGPVILLGTPEDNPLIKTLLTQRFLPYTPKNGEMPGPGRGLVAWQRDGIGVCQESITLIAHDTQGMAEAVGTMYEMLAGIEPLTPWTLAKNSSIEPAKKGVTVPEAAVAWSVVLPDRIVGVKANNGKLSVLSHDGTLAEVSLEGKVTGQKVLDAAAYQKSSGELRPSSSGPALAEAQKKADPRRLVKFVIPSGTQTAVVYWGGTLQILDADSAVKTEQRFGQDITAAAWSGQQLILGDANGRLSAVSVK
jgi:hypothetical protein